MIVFSVHLLKNSPSLMTPMCFMERSLGVRVTNSLVHSCLCVQSVLTKISSGQNSRKTTVAVDADVLIVVTECQLIRSCSIFLCCDVRVTKSHCLTVSAEVMSTSRLRFKRIPVQHALANLFGNCVPN